ncbi:hypothetical protein AB6A23_12810 [Paenibacillus tarimensis]
MNKQNLDVYAPVKASNTDYDERKIIDDDNNPINSEAENAMAAIKGHIERQDMEGMDIAPSADAAPTASLDISNVTAKENYKLDNSHIMVKNNPE